jgi:CheY-like chemotaxis protein
MAENTSKKILIIDDEQTTLMYLSSLLERANYEVISTTKGKEVLGLALNYKPDLIILDIVLPDIDGGEVAAILAKNNSTADIPIIFLTGIMKKDEETFAGKTGKRYVIAKPVTREKLIETINKVLPR